jgi:hypothetical protein
MTLLNLKMFGAFAVLYGTVTLLLVLYLHLMSLSWGTVWHILQSCRILNVTAVASKPGNSFIRRY